jgi:peptide-methionine (S)-S-oxide reductase
MKGSENMDTKQNSQFQTATFAAGCFWQVEETFRSLPGVATTTVGYTGGTRENPSYQDVCTGRTGHAEAVQIVFDPSVVSYGSLLDTFWKSHDPTTRNRQGWDLGTQYRSAIFFQDSVQEAEARKSREASQPQFKREIVTEITPAAVFYPAEDYHQKYLAKRGEAACPA